ncbi:MAG: hypothetical protein EAZ20_07350 [Bacteroidetes bacterium]|nr:MAG: hypothetical protein EAZ20_07350 [Bacteroidota bacterium]
MIVLLLFLLALNLNAQNLVPNGSFEECISYPNTSRQGYLVYNWGSICLLQNAIYDEHFAIPSQKNDIKVVHTYNKNGTMYKAKGYSDYYHKYSKNGYFHSGKHKRGYQKAKKGKGFVGFDVSTGKGKGRYIYVKLDEILSKDITYKVSMYVCLDDISLNTTNIGFSLCDTFAIVNGKLNVTPQLISSKSITNRKKWKKLETNYKALGNEKYLIIGSFNPSVSQISKTNFSKRKLKNIEKISPIISYYFVDEVEVKKCYNTNNNIEQKIIFNNSLTTNINYNKTNIENYFYDSHRLSIFNNIESQNMLDEIVFNYKYKSVKNIKIIYSNINEMESIIEYFITKGINTKDIMSEYYKNNSKIIKITIKN